MKQLEVVLGSLIILLMVFSLLVLMPYASAILTLLCLFLGGLYFYFSFLLLNSIRLRHAFKKNSYDHVSLWRLLGTIFTGVVLALVVIYALFKFQSWPYGQDGLSISLGLLIFVIAIVLLKLYQTKHVFYRNLLKRLLIIGCLASILFLLSYEQILEIRYRDYPDYIKAEKEFMADPTNTMLEERANEERMKIDLK